MPEAALDVQAAPVRARHLPERQDVDARADARRREDEAAAYVGRRLEAAQRLDDDQRAEQQERRAVGLRGEDLGPPEPERHPPSGRASRETCGPDAHAERGGVDQHVGGVGEERQRVRDDRERDLGDHEPDDQRQGVGERADLRLGGNTVIVSVLVAHSRSVTPWSGVNMQRRLDGAAQERRCRLGRRRSGL